MNYFPALNIDAPDAVPLATGWTNDAQDLAVRGDNGGGNGGVVGISTALQHLGAAVAAKSQDTTDSINAVDAQLTQISELIRWINIVRGLAQGANIPVEVGAAYLEWLAGLELALQQIATEVTAIPKVDADLLTDNINRIKAELVDTALALEAQAGLGGTGTGGAMTQQERTNWAQAHGEDAASNAVNQMKSMNAPTGQPGTDLFQGGGRRMRRTKRGGYTYGRSPRRSTRRSTPRKAKKTTPTRTRSRRRGKRRGRKRTKGRASTHSRR
jgi:hypothetical protein